MASMEMAIMDEQAVNWGTLFILIIRGLERTKPAVKPSQEMVAIWMEVRLRLRPLKMEGPKTKMVSRPLLARLKYSMQSMAWGVSQVFTGKHPTTGFRKLPEDIAWKQEFATRVLVQFTISANSS